jgi:hypothetical protein
MILTRKRIMNMTKKKNNPAKIGIITSKKMERMKSLMMMMKRVKMIRMRRTMKPKKLTSKQLKIIKFKIITG